MRPISRYLSSSRLSRVLSGVGAAAMIAAAVPAARAQDAKPEPAAAPAAAVHPSGPALTGFWTAYNDDGRPGGVFYFYKKDGLYEGRLVKEVTYPEDPPENPLCTHCPGEKKDKPMLGLVIVWGMKKTSATKYENGHVLDPRDGSVWSAQLEVSPDDQKLNLRGYLATPLLGQTRVWTRLPDDTMAIADIPGDPLPEPAAVPVKKHGGHGAGSATHSAPHPAKPRSATTHPE